ncbi:inositol monophosphatase family protein [Paenibacillus sp. GCM10027629]|uniref:inositol monophosphatase family protein n=1 Tax=Paenibacillus sp. GCM10027629 TaxID=3273414 RepID=UPI003639906F
MQDKISLATEVAIKAVVEAGNLAKEYFFKEKEIVEKGEDGDVVTIVDHLAEKIILQSILAHFPDDQIRSEETGWSGNESDWLWLVDPLDGTNNYAIGLPVYGVSVTLIYKKEPVLGVIYDSHLGDLYVAQKDKGATLNGKPLSIGKNLKKTNKMTVGWIQGHLVQKDEKAMSLKHELDIEFKRVLRLWAPTLLWCMLARGDIDGIFLFNSEGDDLYSGILIAKEAGASIVDFNGGDFEGMNPEPYIIACHPEHKHSFINLVKQTLKLS